MPGAAPYEPSCIWESFCIAPDRRNAIPDIGEISEITVPAFVMVCQKQHSIRVNEDPSCKVDRLMRSEASWCEGAPGGNPKQRKYIPKGKFAHKARPDPGQRRQVMVSANCVGIKHSRIDGVKR